MKLVIDIPEEMYKDYVLVNLSRGNGKNIVYDFLKAIKHGTPLPKGHGRLIDADEIIRELGSYHIGGLDAIKNYNGENTWEDGLHTAWRVIDDAETIIPAESEGEG